MRGWVRFSVFLLVLASSATAGAQAQAPSGDPIKYEAFEPGVWPVLSALGPGFVLRGAGAYVAGDRRAARNLLIMEGVGLAGLFGGGALIATSGASRRFIALGAPIVIVGTSIFMLTWVADLYAASTGGRSDHVASFTSPLEAELGYRYVYDPQFGYRNFAHARADLRVSGLRLSPSAWVAADDDNQRLSLDAAYRLRGRRPRRVTQDGSYLDLATAVTSHRYGSEGFTIYTPEWRVEGRIDLVHFGASLRGAFAEGSLGAGLELYDFHVKGARGLDATGLLLGRTAFGVYFGQDDVHTGEAVFYYDHRHDDYAAGLGVSGIGGGFLGHLGLSGHYFPSYHWGAGMLLEVGSAWVSGLSLRYRHGALR